MHLDNQSYLNQLYENNPRFFNISPKPESNPRSNKKVTMESLQNQSSETAAVVREIQISQKTILEVFFSLFFSLLGLLAIRNLSLSLCLCRFYFSLAIFPNINFNLLLVLNVNIF